MTTVQNLVHIFPTVYVSNLFLLHCSCVVDCTDGSWDMVSLGEIAFWSLEGGDTVSCSESNDPLGMLAVSVAHNVLGHRHESTACSKPVISPTL